MQSPQGNDDQTEVARVAPAAAAAPEKREDRWQRSPIVYRCPAFKLETHGRERPQMELLHA